MKSAEKILDENLWGVHKQIVDHSHWALKKQILEAMKEYIKQVQ